MKSITELEAAMQELSPVEIETVHSFCNGMYSIQITMPKNSFLFGCYTGLRFSDIASLKWSNIKDELIQITQTKTKGAVYIPLNANAESILKLQGDNIDFILKLSRFNSSVNRTFRNLISKNSRNKDVSFHS